jgi:N-methylhydantoinase A
VSARKELLSSVDSVRYATTLGTNALIERKGPKIGLLTTAGFESTAVLIGAAAPMATV